MKMLNKEECEKALQSAEEKTMEIEDYNSIPTSKYCYIEDELSIFKKLIKEHFELVEKYNRIYSECPQKCVRLKQLIDEVNKYKHEYYSMCDLFENPQPYKFEDLKKEMWVWDDKKMDFYHVCEKIVNKDGTKILANETHYRLFEENRFFPITKALQYQGKEDASK